MTAILKPKHFKHALSNIDIKFPNPKIKLEQYPTDIETTSELIYMIQSQYGDIENKMVADLGCGTGVLCIGAALLGASYVLGIDIDQDALDLCQENCEIFEQDSNTIDLLNYDVTLLGNLPETRADVEDESEMCGHSKCRFYKNFDTVIMNPPFGTKKNEGIDMKFVEIALSMAKSAVYSFHKTSTRSHIIKKAKGWGVEMEILGNVVFPIPQVYKCHKLKSIDIEVDFIRFYHK